MSIWVVRGCCQSWGRLGFRFEVTKFFFTEKSRLLIGLLAQDCIGGLERVFVSDDHRYQGAMWEIFAASP